MCNEFNELRSEMVLLYELKNALAACEQELHSLKGQFEAACPGKVLNFILTPKVLANCTAIFDQYYKIIRVDSDGKLKHVSY